MNMKQWLKNFVHNCVVHPAMPFLPVRVANLLHDKNANWAFGLERFDEVGLEQGLMTRKFDESEITKHFTLTSKDLISIFEEAEKKRIKECAEIVHEGLKDDACVRLIADRLCEDTANGGTLYKWLIRPISNDFPS